MSSWLHRNKGHLLTLMASVGVSGGLQLYLARPPGTAMELTVIEPTTTVVGVEAAMPGALTPSPAAASPTAEPTLAPTPTQGATATPAPVAVFVSGEVLRPDVYLLPPGSLIRDAIVAAGGLTTAADQAAINQALRVGDGMQINVPSIGLAPTPPTLSEASPTLVPTLPAVAPAPTQVSSLPEAPSPAPGASVASPEGGLININTATAAQFETLPGIGPTLAERIVAHREANGPFATIDQIKDVAGIGDKIFENIRPLIVVQ